MGIDLRTWPRESSNGDVVLFVERRAVASVKAENVRRMLVRVGKRIDVMRYLHGEMVMIYGNAGI